MGAAPPSPLGSNSYTHISENRVFLELYRSCDLNVVRDIFLLLLALQLLALQLLELRCQL
jgi:hypothetical protein